MKKLAMLLAIIAVLALGTGSVYADPGEPGVGGQSIEINK